MVEWLRDAYVELVQKTPLDLEDSELQPTTSIDWETLARISNLQTKVAISIMSFDGDDYECDECNMEYGGSYPKGCLCKCRLLSMVDEAFRRELEIYPGYIKLPLPRFHVS